MMFYGICVVFGSCLVREGPYQSVSQIPWLYLLSLSSILGPIAFATYDDGGTCLCHSSCDYGYCFLLLHVCSFPTKRPDAAIRIRNFILGPSDPE